MKLAKKYLVIKERKNLAWKKGDFITFLSELKEYRLTDKFARPIISVDDQPDETFMTLALEVGIIKKI